MTGRDGGRDLVTDVHSAESDRIGLAGTPHRQVRSNGSGDTVIDFRRSSALTLAGIAPDDVTSAWFAVV